MMTAAEVVEYEHERRAVTRGLTGATSFGSETTLEPVGPGSARITVSCWQNLPAGIPADFAERADRELREYVESEARGLARMFAAPGDVV